ncbi:hypothetical protein DFH05DRAFT_1470822 [Lentinula detonsa]|uniref:F-box domain-containing protein n=1 Tax=Lentinula detonsa TaxID=2804962 RepID=A0A9W8PCN9_9AGAR|nr:hypothetical protein DFH05DRAFT_1470822 [Lentinula detonsa]
MSMARRSARLQVKEAVNTSNSPQNVTATQSLEHGEQDDEEQEERPRKRAKRISAESSGKKAKKKGIASKQLRRVRGKLGLLERLAKDAPMEVILEVFCHLEPRDLLRLARTSRELRNLLMSKTLENIWRAARQNVEDLPPCPHDLSEPQYAFLIYEPICHLCDRRVESVLWSFRMRCCQDCASDLSKFPQYDEEFFARLPQEFRSYDILPRDLILTSERWSWTGHNEITARYKAEYETLQTTEERKTWLNRKEKESQQSRNHRFLCAQWMCRRDIERARELDKLRQQRKEDILTRLNDIGWREEAEIIMKSQRLITWRKDSFAQHKSVNQPRKLTEYGWNIIKDELVTMLSNHKEKRLQTEI